MVLVNSSEAPMRYAETRYTEKRDRCVQLAIATNTPISTLTVQMLLRVWPSTTFVFLAGGVPGIRSYFSSTTVAVFQQH